MNTRPQKDQQSANHSTFICAGYPVSVSGMITVPVSASMYQTVVANLQQIHTQGDGSIQVRTVLQLKVAICCYNRRQDAEKHILF
jgi:hypothetical protein